MKMIRKLRKLRMLLLVALMGSSFGVFAQTHVYITGTDTGTNSNCPAPPAGTPAANKVTTFYAAIQRANAVGGNVVIHLRTNQLRETSPCPTIKQNVNVQVINDTPYRKAIRYNPEAYEKSHRLIPVNGTLTLGGEGCTSVLIVRGQPFDPYYYPYNEDGEDGETIPPVVLIKANEGTVNIENNCEVCYGRVNVWISYKTGVVNLREGGVIHSALDMNVNVTQGTFNMEGGYIMGHYYTSGNTVPDLEANPILDRENFLAANFTKNGTMDYHLDQYDIRDALEAYYPIDTTDDNSKINSACGVYVHCHKDGSGKHLAKFNMSGGSICGIYGKRIRQVIEGASGTTYQYYTNPETEGPYEIINNAVYVNGGECNISGGYIYANHTASSGGGIILTSKDFDDLDPNENYEHTHFNMTGGVVKYCSGGTGGALRIEYGATATMSGGALTHCVSVPGDLINDTTNAQRGGGGGIRMVSSKFTMSGDAEISWCHSPTISEAMNGGGIGAVWQPGFGYVYTTLELHGGSIHHNRSESYGGGVTATDKGNVGVVGGIAVTIKGCSIHDNYAAKHGAGIYIGGNSSVYIDKSEDGTTKAAIYNNVAERNGGGVFVSSSHMQEGGVRGLLDSKNCDIYNNSAINGGGIYTEYADVNVHGGVQIYQHDIPGTGGGVCIAKEADYFQDGGEIGLVSAPNNATEGGGIYIFGGNLRMVDGSISYNTATKNGDTGGNGGGFCVKGGTVSVEGGTISYNDAEQNGGGFYVEVPNTTDITYIKTGAEVSHNTAVNGAGAYINQGQLVIQDAATNITTNTASTNGGGIYMSNGTVTVSNAMVQTNTATGGNGGGLYVGNGDITLSGAKVSGNSATNGQGGGIYAGNGNIQVKDGTQVGTYSAKVGSGNSAKEGGGLYVNGGTVVFTDGTFADNQASEKGGGIYIKDGATLNLRETATITRNHVPATGQGGGVYMNGTLNVGENATDPATKHAIIVRDNYAGSAYSLATRNNVFLPSTTKYITLLSDIHSSASKVGFSVTQGFCPVIYTDIEGANASHEQWLYDLLGGTSGLTGAIFDDAQKYFALHVRTDQGPFEAKYDYLWGAWTTHVYHNPNEHLDEYPLPTGVSTHFTEESDGWHIYTKEGLAWFISYVNDLNGAGEHRSANAFLENDVDMSGHLWVPIGGTTSFDSEQGIFADGGYYNGHFDGKGHIISNLDCRYMNAVLKIGLFGKVTGGSITNTFVDGYQFLTQFSDKAYYLGGIAGWATGGTISNCEARGLMETEFCEGSESYMGGLVGKLEGATVHSSMAMPTMTGIAQHMGGLAGYVASSNTLKNSFSNAEITRGSNNSQIGGLAGTNSGTIENCYVRLRGTEPANFGWFAGSNGGSIQYCYALDGHTNYVNTGTAPIGSGNYAPTALEGGKYGYAHQDQEVTATNTYVENGAIDNQGELKGLLATLNNWVEAQPATAGYSTWTRTMASPINDDLPILEFDDFVSAGSTDNVFIAYKDDLNDMIDYANGNSTGGSVYLYDATPTAVSESTNGNVRVYIAPNVGITQTANNTLNARVGVTLDNSSTDFMAYDWHMFSSALQSAPMGLVYHGDEGTYYVRDNYTTLAAQGITHADYTDPTKMDPPMTTWNTTPGQIGYFPTDAPYGPWRNTGSLSQGFDFYCFHEPSRHWINFKREGKAGFYDHWHQNADENGMHQNIGYTNEADMEVGKGYMLAITAPSMLMTDGVLNNGDKSRNASFTAGGTYDYPLRGINLVGNPYQSYLDFNAFANENGFDTYYILDADKRGYIAYTAGATPQVDAPSRYIHPHQGFFVRVTETQDIEFNNEMRVAGPNSSFESDYRDWEPRYALVNMVCTDGEGRNDFATIELDRPEQGGGRKAKGLRSGDASIWFRLGDEDYQIAFAPVGTQSAPLRFEAYSDGVYTLRWNMQNADFGYLHLVDNLTGADIDCLTTEEYRFEAKTSDYTSRFRLVFDFTGIDDPEAPEPAEGPTSFAFMMGDELVINGEGVLQMFDLNGRQLFSTEIHGTQATVAMPKVADGIYVLRLTNGNQVRTQKMVINK